MDAELINARRRAVRASLKAKRLDGLVVTSGVNVRYLSGFQGDDSWLVVTKRGCYLFTDSRYTEQAEAECVDTFVVERTGAMSDAIAVKVNGLKSVKNCGIEGGSTVEAYQVLKKKLGPKLKAVGHIVEKVRRAKDGSEVDRIKRAAKVAWRALAETKKGLKKGVSENEIAALLEYHISAMGCGVAFDSIVAFGENGSRPHHLPGGRKLRKNDVILIDFGAKYDGYCCDITRCFVWGRASGYYKKVYETVERAQREAMGLVRAGAKVSDIDGAAREVIEAEGLPAFGHGLGHGLGLAVHEYPTVSGRSDGTLEEGDVITIEPGVYLPGRFGVRIEDDVLVRADGFKLLTSGKGGSYVQGFRI